MLADGVHVGVPDAVHDADRLPGQLSHDRPVLKPEVALVVHRIIGRVQQENAPHVQHAPLAVAVEEIARIVQREREHRVAPSDGRLLWMHPRAPKQGVRRRLVIRLARLLRMPRRLLQVLEHVATGSHQRARVQVGSDSRRHVEVVPS
eukprot:7337808-Prymnesium_polylepis.2